MKIDEIDDPKAQNLWQLIKTANNLVIEQQKNTEVEDNIIVINELIKKNEAKAIEKGINSKIISTLKEIDRLVKDGVDINAKDKAGSPLLIKALIDNDTDNNYPCYPEAALLLLELGANRNVKTRNDNLACYPMNVSVLNFAISRGLSSVTEKLIELGENINDVGGITSKAPPDRTKPFLFSVPPLHFAAGNWDEKLITVILKCCNDIDIKDQHGQTPMHYAARYKLENVQYLETKGASSNIVDNEGQQPIHKAAYANKVDILQYLNRDVKCEITNKEGRTPFYIAETELNMDSIQYFKSIGAKSNSRDINGQTPLHRIAKERSYHRFKCLIKAGAPLNEPDSQDLTPLYIAIQEGRDQFVKCLLKDSSDADKLESIINKSKVELNKKILECVVTYPEAYDNNCKNPILSKLISLMTATFEQHGDLIKKLPELIDDGLIKKLSELPERQERLGKYDIITQIKLDYYKTLISKIFAKDSAKDLEILRVLVPEYEKTCIDYFNNKLPKEVLTNFMHFKNNNPPMESIDMNLNGQQLYSEGD